MEAQSSLPTSELVASQAEVATYAYVHLYIKDACTSMLPKTAGPSGVLPMLPGTIYVTRKRHNAPRVPRYLPPGHEVQGSKAHGVDRVTVSTLKDHMAPILWAFQRFTRLHFSTDWHALTTCRHNPWAMARASPALPAV